MTTSIKVYLPLAGLAITSRLVLEFLPAQAATASQTMIIQWPIVLLAAILGFPAMHIAHRLGTQQSVNLPASLNRSVPSLGFGMLSAVLLIALDIAYVFPEDMNVLGLKGIPFYLLGAFLVETIQHLLPLAIWLALVGQLMLRGRHEKYVFWTGAGVVSILEPASQLGGDYLSGYSPTFFVLAATLFFCINLAQLYFFRRSGFVPMLAYRIGMYSIWHWLWGVLRLRLLF